MYFLDSGSMFRQLASLRRLPLDAGSPVSRVLSSCCDFPRSRFAFSVPLVSDTLCRAISVSRRSHAFIELLWSPGLFRDFIGRGGTSQVSAKPQLSVRACSWTPVGPPFQTIRKGDVAPQYSEVEAPTIILRFEARWQGIRTGCLRFAAPFPAAGDLALADDDSSPRKTRFRRWSALPGGRVPQGSPKGFHYVDFT